MIQLDNIRVRNFGDRSIYVIQFSAFGDTPDFMSVEIPVGEAKSIDDVVEMGREAVINLLRGLIEDDGEVA
ncbi:hypothetical protein [Rhizobium nepotum]|uniref:hypothetical protein n=1 Tax=Rhizobium nepotum TaxID=1035271 RepID=UPI003CE6A7FB